MDKMTLTRRGSGFAINGNYEQIHLTLTMLKQWYEELAGNDTAPLSAVLIMQGYVRETGDLLNRLEALENAEQRLKSALDCKVE